MHPEAREELRVRFRKTVLDFAAEIGVTKACLEFGVARSRFCEWKTRYDRDGMKGLYRRRSVRLSCAWRTGPEVIDKILEQPIRRGLLKPSRGTVYKPMLMYYPREN